MEDRKRALPTALRFWAMNSPSFHNVHRHGSCSGDETTDHAGTEVAKDIVREVAWKVKRAASSLGWLRPGGALGAEL